MGVASSIRRIRVDLELAERREFLRPLPGDLEIDAAA
jgi:hypothetical protein